MQRQAGGNHSRGGNVREMLERSDSLEELSEISVEDDTDEADVRLSDDEVFEVLYSSLRRNLITYVQEQGGESTVSDIAEHLAAKENDTTVQQLSSYERKRVYIGLYQNHLPKLDDLGVVEYDKNRGIVRLCKCATQLEPYLQDVDNSTASRVKVGGVVLLVGVILLGILNIGAFAVAPDLLWIALGIAGLFGLTALDAYDAL